MRAHLVFFRILRYLCLRIFLRRFLTTEDIYPPVYEVRRVSEPLDA